MSLADSLGLMDRFSSFRAPLKLPGEMAAAMADLRFPFVDKVVAFEEGQRLTTSTLSTSDHPFLVDRHRRRPLSSGCDGAGDV